MQGKDPFFVLLGVFILGMTFFFCGKGSVTPPPPVTLENSTETPPSASTLVEPPPSPPPVPPVSVPAMLTKKIDDLLTGHTMAFRINSAILLPEGKSVLNSVATILHKDPTVTLEVGRHTNSVGPEHANRVLMEQRGETVIDYLISQGIAAERLISGGYGASRPIAGGAIDEGRPQDRQREFSIETKGEQS